LFDEGYLGSCQDWADFRLAGLGCRHGLTQAGPKSMPKRAFLTDTKPTRTNGTTRSYLKGGLVLLARALKRMTGPGDVIDAFRQLFEDPELAYRPATTRAYQQQIKAVIARKLHDEELGRERAISGFAELKALLKARRGPCPKRASRKKLKAGTHAEYRRLLADFADRVRLSGGLDRTDIVLSMLIKVGPFFGLRPCEWLNATILDNELKVVNAKGGNGRAMGEVRAIGIASLPRKIVKSAQLLIEQILLLFAEVGGDWRKILGRLGERLARICARIEIQRWSLYTTRHVAMATWKRAGLSDAEIAALAGHSSTRTARQHYAGGRHGWAPEFACARPDSDLVDSIVSYNGVASVAVSAKNEPLKVALASALIPTEMPGPSALPAARPHRVIVSQQYEGAKFVPIIKVEVMLKPSQIDVIGEADEVPVFSMG
jgi:integrase